MSITKLSIWMCIVLGVCISDVHMTKWKPMNFVGSIDPTSSSMEDELKVYDEKELSQLSNRFRMSLMRAMEDALVQKMSEPSEAAIVETNGPQMRSQRHHLYVDSAFPFLARN